MRKTILSLMAMLCLSSMASAATLPKLFEPRLTIPAGGQKGPRVALTLDACSGGADQRILGALVSNHISATIFATAIWIRHNPSALAEIRHHPELFEIENHGALHRPAVDAPMRVFGLAAAGSGAAVRSEVAGGAGAVAAATGRQPRWFRGATGKYTLTAMHQIRRMNEEIAGYSLIADAGATLGTQATKKRIARAHDGDVIIAHINQPTHAAGLGVIEGVLALKSRHYTFVRLEDAWSKQPTPAATLSY